MRRDGKMEDEHGRKKRDKVWGSDTSNGDEEKRRHDMWKKMERIWTL